MPGPIDPDVTGARVRIETVSGDVVVDEVLPPRAFDPTTGTGWKANATRTRFAFKNPGLLDLAGIRSASVKVDALGQVTMAIKGKFGAYGVDPGDLPGTLMLALEAPRADDGRCASATFTTPPDPACVYDGAAGKLTCR